MSTFKTDKQGRFSFSGFQFYDSSTVALQAINKKGRPYGTFTLTTNEFPTITKLPQFVPLRLERVQRAVKTSNAVDIEGAVVLKEVTVKGKREKPYRDMYYSGDVSLSGERIRELNPTNLLSIFRSRVPRVRLTVRMDEMGIMRETLFIPGMGTPMLVVDGVPIAQESMMSTIQQIDVNTVESIEVLASSSAAIYGSRAANGVVIILTKGQFSSYDKGTPSQFSARDFITFPFVGYTSFDPFQQSGDSETTIYWNPYVLTNDSEPQQVTFFAGIEAAAYRVEVKGVTRDGQNVSGSFLIELSR
jgi:TonB-dependent SusC/RagA subfamily outer membrane receptor